MQILDAAIKGLMACGITLLFAGDAAIQLDARAIAATLEDFGEPWPAAVTPAHPAAVRPRQG